MKSIPAVSKRLAGGRAQRTPPEARNAKIPHPGGMPAQGSERRQCGAADGRRSNRRILASRWDAGVIARPIPAVALR